MSTMGKRLRLLSFGKNQTQYILGTWPQSKGFLGNTFMNSPQGLEACEPRVLELEWSRADEGVEVTLVRNHLK